MANTSQLIQYLRHCYEADNRETGVYDLFHGKVRHRRFFNGTEDLLCGVLDRLPVDRDVAELARKEAELYRKEKSLIYACFPIVARLAGNRPGPNRLCAPLLFYPAALVEDAGGISLTVDLAEQRVNWPALSILTGSDNHDPSELLAEDLFHELPQAPFDQSAVYAWMAALADCIPHVDVLPLAQYPRLVDEQDVRATVKRVTAAETTQVTCLPACAMALIPNSPDTRGVLHDLRQMTELTSHSPPLVALLQGFPESGAAGEPARRAVPAVLSRSQQRILESAASAPLTLVIGPPGTGKSYTIAALAIDHLSRGESVLISSRMDHAVDVVADKIQTLIGTTPCVIRGGRGQHLRQLKTFLEQILQGLLPRDDTPREPSRQLARQLKRVDGEVQSLERSIARRIGWEHRWGSLHCEAAGSGLLRSLTRWTALRYLDYRIRQSGPLWNRVQQYRQKLQQRIRLTVALLQTTVAERIRNMTQHHRPELNKLLQAIKARSEAKQQRLFAQMDLQRLFKTFPIWLITLPDLSEVLPIESQWFDVAIIDEATQCDIASCLPLLERARRAVIVGDPNQLRHVSFLARSRQTQLADRYQLDERERSLLDYRDKSILDVTSESIPSQQHVILLDEHFRSLPPIIQFSNQTIYGGALKIMTQRPGTIQVPCVQLRHVQGQRDGSGRNRQEAEALVDELERIVRREETAAGPRPSSIGVLSPFRDQVDYLSSLVEKRLPWPAFQRHDLLVGTAHTFQGEERDIMLISLAVDPSSHHASFQFVNNLNMFNVTITRARHQQIVFSSVHPDEVRAGGIFRQYLAAISHGATAGEHPISSTHHDRFLGEVSHEMQTLGYRTWPAFPVAGLTIDLMAEHHGKTLGIDLIGYPGEFAQALDLERYRMFQRADLDLFPLPYSAWQADKQQCLDAIQWKRGQVHFPGPRSPLQ